MDFPPMFATLPPGRTITVAIVNISGTPTASMAASTPRPSVQAITRSFQFGSPELTVSVAPKGAGPCQSGVVQIDGDDLGRAVEPRRHDGGKTDRSGPDYSHDIAWARVPILNADLESGGQDVGEENALGVGHSFRDLVNRILRKQHEFGLGTVDHAAEDQPIPATLRDKTMTVNAFAAAAAPSAGGDAAG